MKMTLPQEDIYFEQLMYPDDPIYNIGAKIAIKGSISYAVLNKAYLALINQHDTYRCLLQETEKNVSMRVLEHFDNALEYMDFSSYQNPDEKANEFMQNTFQKAFSFNDQQFLHRFIFIKIKEDFHYLFSVYHHIITDGWGTSLMFQRLVKNYNELIEQGTITTEYPFTYQDFVTDDSAYAESEEYQLSKKYWEDVFAQLPERLFEKNGRIGKTNQSSRKAIYIKRNTYNQLTQVAKAAGGSTFHAILAALYLYFGRKHQNKDFAIGLPVLNRGKSIFKKTVGLFMGVSPLRMKLDFENTFAELVKDIRQQLRQNYRHQRFPLGKLIKSLGIFHEKDRLFNITLSYEKQNYADHFSGTETTVIPLSHRSERVALAIYIREFDASEDVKIDFDYNLNYFDANTIAQVTSHFEQLLEAIIEDAQRPLCDYQYLTTTEQKQLLHTFNQTTFAYPAENTLIDFFKKQVDANRDKVALKDEHNQYTYQELDRLSDQIAHYLNQHLGGNRELPVAVLMERSARLVATFLGVLKSGRAYLPLDPAFPEERLAFIMEHSEAQTVISTKKLIADYPFAKSGVSFEKLMTTPFDSTVLTMPCPDDKAYIIYTSGSTGQPKGVVVGHWALINFLLSIKQRPGIDADDLLFSVTTQSFDISILEFFAPLISGASIYVANQALLKDPLEIVAKIETLHPTIIQATPSFYQLLFNAGWQGDKKLKVLCGGDLLSQQLAKRLLDASGQLWNMYGPTETTIWSTCKQILQPEEASNIGQPIHNTQIYILDEKLQLLPIGSAGALFIGGDGLAKGYYKKTALTNAKFIANPFVANQKMYDTGDLAHWNKDGTIAFLGRNDLQVKIRGFRIELGEIETKLHQMDAIKNAVVIARKSNHTASLIAYVIPATKQFEPDKIIEELKNELPEYMIPYIIIPIEQFPLTPNKKVDRKALQNRVVGLNKLRLTKKPASELELDLYQWFKKVLSLKDEFSIKDNFFALGGDSLMAVKLIHFVDKELSIRITLKDIFEYPTIQLLARFLENRKTVEEINIPIAAEQSSYALTPAQHGMWLAAQQKEKSIAYNMSALFKVQGIIDKQILEVLFLELVKKYEILRANFIEEKGQPRLQFKPLDAAKIKIDELQIQEKELKLVIEDYLHMAFNLEQDFLMKIAIAYDSEQQTYLIFNTHHIIMDGWSLELLINEVITNYKLLAANKAPLIASPAIQFKDYASWLYQQENKIDQTNTAFWVNYLEQYKWEATIPFDEENPMLPNQGASMDFEFSDIRIEELKELALQKKVSLHTLIASALNILIYKMTTRQDICIGTLNAGRSLHSLEKQLGMFVKTLPLRTQLDGAWTIEELLQTVQKNIWAIDQHQDIPESVMASTRLDVLLVVEHPMHNYDQINLHEDTILHWQPVPPAHSRLPLLIQLKINGAYLRGIIDYNASNFDSSTIELLQLKLEKVLQMLLQAPQQDLESLNIDLEMEKSKSIDISFNF